MARPRQPTNLILAKGTKHFSQDEIKERLSREVQPCTDDIVAPSFLSAEQVERFNKLARQLQKIKIMGETDIETLARYVIAQESYELAVADLMMAREQCPKGNEVSIETMTIYADMLTKLDKRIDRYFKQATAGASKLGLTISDRCKLVVPVKEEQPKQNKFTQLKPAKQQGSGVIYDRVQ